MKLIKAIIRPEKVDDVIDALEKAGYPSFTKIDVVGRGKQGGLKVGEIFYDELPKTMLLIGVNDDEVDEVVEIIKTNAYTGNFGDGKIFIQPIEEVYTIRTGAKEL
ncbi:nitrogen regulatory protein P-II [Methanocaldococcus sp. FS406-22]|uniref:NifI1 n=1 Tax=hyperthermophilic methanogen FS406-22 TaxID=412882 RepID=A0T2Q4_9EURY|nr:P-II family nitrogen regulator [Methanocaldococcus sp. FS406-22]ABK78682.1 NifI1 [hyperthermophilic methanogen FS406-22]ADC68733.1 nitrogen regulatory protein P-II [Methanocaldococcus sp. FS406-22]